jgi:hypothetical protein
MIYAVESSAHSIQELKEQRELIAILNQKVSAYDTLPAQKQFIKVCAQ